jgi:Lysyl oxidase
VLHAVRLSLPWLGAAWLTACGTRPGASPDGLGPPPVDAAVDAAPDAMIDAPDASPFDAPPGIADLQFVTSEMTSSVVVTNDLFRDGDCEVLEGCVGAPGNRTLVRFDTVSANRGTADVFVGVPPPPGESNEIFQWSPCHMHHHVKNYASYELRDASGDVVLTARKQSFCLEDGEPIQPGIPATGYSCARQGITRGWADVYSRYLPCQWIDVSELPSGTYTLHLVVNPMRLIPESNYDNNEFSTIVQF